MGELISSLWMSIPIRPNRAMHVPLSLLTQMVMPSVSISTFGGTFLVFSGLVSVVFMFLKGFTFAIAAILFPRLFRGRHSFISEFLIQAPVCRELLHTLSPG